MTRLTVQTSLLTTSQTVFMGMIDAYTVGHFDGTFASAQTGNLVIFGVILVKNGFTQASVHIPVFIGFLLGAVFAQEFRYFIKIKCQSSAITQLRVYTATSILTALLIFTTLNWVTSSAVVVLTLLGLYASYELTLFNHIGQTSVNNGIMTGNIKNFGNLLADFIRNPQKKLVGPLCSIGGNILMFMTGVIIGTYFFKQLSGSILLSGIGLNTILLLGLFVPGTMKPQSELADN